MTAALLMAWLAGVLAPPLPLPSPPDLHIVFRSEFVYQASTRTTSNEWWVSDGKSLARQGDRLSIYREDLGVVWRASVKAGTYTETKIPPAGQPVTTPPAPGKVDMHVAGYDWEPNYDWAVKASGQSSTIAGRPCREFVATGDADYAESRVSFWACDPLPGVTRNPTDTVAAPLRSASVKKMIFDTLAKHGGAWLLAAEEQQEPAIAPTIVMRVQVETLEAVTAPPGTFDMPPTFKKAGAFAVAPAAGQAPAVLSPVVVSELKVLEETYLVLDAVAQKVWPGWTGYRDLPFLFEFENQLQVLVGHPNPPAPFAVVPGVTIGGHAVAADRSKMSAVKVEPPLLAGGGPTNFGAAADGTPVYTVRINVRSARPVGETQAEDQQPPSTEEKVLIYLHELFHCFQRGRIEVRAGNLRFNPDADYATWSQIEGLALERAYKAADAASARERIKEFTVARALKRQSMTDLQRNEESADDVREGTATYSQLRALEIMKSGGFKSGLTNAEDPYYRGFAEADRIIASYAERLAKAAATHEDPKMKCYDYGSFQCALAERLVPGWQQQVEQGKAMDAVLASAIPVADAERPDIERRLRGDYPYEDVRRGATAFTQARDAAYQTISARQGRVYIVDLKPVRQYMEGLAVKAGAYRLGLLTLFPAGYPGFTLDAVELSPTRVPCHTDQLFYFRSVDTESRSRRQALTVSGQRQADGTYVDAVVTTPLFTLKAPKVRIVETGNRVKIQVLARVK